MLNNSDTKVSLKAINWGISFYQATDFNQRLNQYIYELYVKSENIIKESKAKTSNDGDGLVEAVNISKLLKRNLLRKTGGNWEIILIYSTLLYSFVQENFCCYKTNL